MIATRFKNMTNHFKGDAMTQISYIPYSSHREYFTYTSIEQLHAVTSLCGKWDVDYNRLTQSTIYTRDFEITDYDCSKDYFLDMQNFQLHGTVLMNGKACINEGILQGKYDMTQRIHKGNNTLVIIMHHGTTPNQILRQLERLVIIERADDRVVSYDVWANYDHANKLLHIQLKITDIEGAPMPSYTLVDSDNQYVMTGDVDLDVVNDIIYPCQYDTLHTKNGYRLLLDTDDETLVITLDYFNE